MNSAHTKADVNNTVRRHTKLRRAVKIVGPWRVSVSLVFGLVATVLVAWWIQLYGWRYSFPTWSHGTEWKLGESVVENSVVSWSSLYGRPGYRETNLTVLALDFVQSDDRLSHLLEKPRDLPGFLKTPVRYVTKAMELEQGTDLERNSVQGSVTAIGLPTPCLRLWRHKKPTWRSTRRIHYEYGGNVYIQGPVFGIQDRDLAVSPIWSGMLINTVFFGVPMYTLVSLPFFRWSIRHRTKRCCACGYDLDGLTSDTCPECNWRIKRKERGPPSDPAGAGPPPAVHNVAGTGGESVGSWVGR